MSQYFPELQYELQAAIESIGEFLVYRKLCSDNPCRNCGQNFKNSTFEMNAYCWCDDPESDHPNGCPANFIYGDLMVTWYKHIGRGSYQNKLLNLDEIEQIRRACIDSIPSEEMLAERELNRRMSEHAVQEIERMSKEFKQKYPHEGEGVVEDSPQSEFPPEEGC